ncbi:MAG: bacillithiol system redox-active protein YtxJ [Acidobacteriota bacterium]
MVNPLVKELHTLEELEQTFEESKTHPVLLFKHSNACPISSRAFREFKTYLENPDESVSYKLIIVQTARPVSNAIESRLNILHESPQAILVKNGKGIWNASHGAITASRLAETIQSHKNAD